MKFSEYPFDEKLLKAVADLGFEEPTPVQAETFALIQQGKDVEAQSQTGTGKTAAFLLSGLQLMLTDETYMGRKMLVVAPTRELADQIEKEARAIAKYTQFKVGAFYGGVGYNGQEKMLEQGVDVIIGTPGRLLDFAGSGKISFKDVGILVIDEADRLFDMGFYPDMRQMLKGMSDPAYRKTMLFSATLNSNVKNLAWDYLTNPGEIIIEPEQVTVDKIAQELYHVGTEEKFPLMLGLFKRENPNTAIVFTNTKNTAVRVTKKLELNGYTVEYLIGDLPQAKRSKIIADMKAKKLNFLVATDVAARGLHINDLELVINYDLPNEAENYVHRIGRTARAGKSGKAISLACEKYVYGLKAIEDYIEMKIPVLWFTEADLAEDKSRGIRISLDEDERLPSREGRGGRDGGRGPARGGRGGREGGREGGQREGGRGRDGRGRGQPTVIRSSSLVNEITGSKIFKEKPHHAHEPRPAAGHNHGQPGQPHVLPKSEGRGGRRNDGRNADGRRSSQGEKIAAAAAAVNAGKAKPPRGDRPAEQDRRRRAPAEAGSQTAKPRENNRGRGQSGNQKSGNMKDRLNYYKNKYGEDFKPAGGQPAGEKKPGLIAKILGFFTGKK